MPVFLAFPGGSLNKESACNAGDLGSIPGSGRSPSRRKWQPTPALLPGESHGQRSLVGYNPWGHKESDSTEWLALSSSRLWSHLGEGRHMIWLFFVAFLLGFPYLFFVAVIASALWPRSVQFSSVQSLSRVRLFATPWITARQASLSITISRSSLRLTSIESVMPSSHLILCQPLLLLPPVPPSIRVFSNESTLRMRWPKY